MGGEGGVVQYQRDGKVSAVLLFVYFQNVQRSNVLAIANVQAALCAKHRARRSSLVSSQRATLRSCNCLILSLSISLSLSLSIYLSVTPCENKPTN